MSAFHRALRGPTNALPLCLLFCCTSKKKASYKVAECSSIAEYQALTTADMDVQSSRSLRCFPR